MNRFDWLVGELAFVLEIFIEHEGVWTDAAHDDYVNPGRSEEDALFAMSDVCETD